MLEFSEKAVDDRASLSLSPLVAASESRQFPVAESLSLAEAGSLFKPLDIKSCLRGSRACSLREAHIKEFTAAKDVAAVLSGEELLSVDSSAGLRARYAQHGLLFDSAADFLRRVRLDWLKARQTAWDRLGQFECYPETLPSLQVPYEGRLLHIYGISHGFSHISEMGQSYLQVVQNTCLEKELLGEMFFTSAGAFTIADAPDQLLLNRLDWFKHGLKLSLLVPLIFLIKRNAAVFVEQEATPCPRKRGAEDVAFRFSRLNPALQNDLPAYIYLEHFDGRESCEHTTLRSVFQAEFLRAAIKRGVPAEGMIVGFYHAPQVAYYLKFPFGDKRIEDLAAHYASILSMQGREAFNSAWENGPFSRHADFHMLGRLCGYSGYLGLAWALFRHTPTLFSWL